MLTGTRSTRIPKTFPGLISFIAVVEEMQCVSQPCPHYMAQCPGCRLQGVWPEHSPLHSESEARAMPFFLLKCSWS